LPEIRLLKLDLGRPGVFGSGHRVGASHATRWGRDVRRLVDLGLTASHRDARAEQNDHTAAGVHLRPPSVFGREPGCAGPPAVGSAALNAVANAITLIWMSSSLALGSV